METNNKFDYNAYINEQMATIKKEREENIADRKLIDKEKRSDGNFRSNICLVCERSNVEDYRKTPKGYIRKLLSRIENRANKRNLECNIAIEWIIDKLEEIDWKCEVTGIKFDITHNETQSNIKSGYDCPYALSIDRIDSSKGYTEDNVQFVIHWVNWSKSALPISDFIDLCRKVTEYNEI